MLLITKPIVFNISTNQRADKSADSPQLVNDRQLIVTFVVHDLDGLVDAQVRHYAQGSAQIQGGDLFVVPPVFQVKKPVELYFRGDFFTEK